MPIGRHFPSHGYNSTHILCPQLQCPSCTRLLTHLHEISSHLWLLGKLLNIRLVHVLLLPSIVYPTGTHSNVPNTTTPKAFIPWRVFFLNAGVGIKCGLQTSPEAFPELFPGQTLTCPTSYPKSVFPDWSVPLNTDNASCLSGRWLDHMCRN